MSNTVAHIVRQSADREGKLVSCVGMPKEVLHEIPGADIVRQIREELVCKGIISEILIYAGAVRVRGGFSHLVVREGGETIQQNRYDDGVPRLIDQLMVRENAICFARRRPP